MTGGFLLFHETNSPLDFIKPFLIFQFLGVSPPSPLTIGFREWGLFFLRQLIKPIDLYSHAVL